MIGAIIGDTIGSAYEFNNEKTKEFELFTPFTTPTDDSITTIAVIDAILECNPIKYTEEGLESFKKVLIEKFIKWYNKYPRVSYGSMFEQWCRGWNNYKPYNSYGNGSGMRVSPVGWYCNSEKEVKLLSKAVSEVTHSHEEGIKGAEAVAMCIYLARKGKTKDEIKNYVIKHYYPRIKNLNYLALVMYYKFDVTCQGSIPEAIYSFLISEDFEDALRISISIGGDSDTIADMTCAIAEAYYKDIPPYIEDPVRDYLDEDMKELLSKFDEVIKK